MKAKLLIVLLALALALAACGDGGSSGGDTQPPQTTEPVSEHAEESSAAPAEDTDAAAATQLEDAASAETNTTEEEAVDYQTTNSGLQYAILEEGGGEAPEAGSLVSVHYTGTLEDGTKFDSSYDRGQPIEFALGQGQVIPGWDEGIALLNVGDKARLRIPPELAYGSQGAGNVIPPNSTLIFDVELVGVAPPPPPPPEAPAEVDEADYTTTDSGLQYAVLEEGDGASPQPGQVATVHYTGWLEDGTMFDSSLSRGRPFSFVVGQGQVIPGWDEGVALMSVGSSYQLVIPSDLAYGEQGAGGVIPPNATLIFEVELLDVQ